MKKQHGMRPVPQSPEEAIRIGRIAVDELERRGIHERTKIPGVYRWDPAVKS
jgi:hypothetical protein